MNSEELARALEPWMRIDTWHTSHPLDEQRFHKCLRTVEETFGTQVDYQDFKDAMEYIFESHHSAKLAIENFEQRIEEKAQQAEVIFSYLNDISAT